MRCVVVAVACVCLALCALAAGPLPKVKINPDTMTVSGGSAGAAFAVQFEIAWSKTIKGGAILAGGPYLCADDFNIKDALECMIDPKGIDIPKLIGYARHAEHLGEIDPLVHVANHSVMLWSGKKDTVVPQGTMEKLAEQYQQLNVTTLATEFWCNAEHTWPTSKYGNKCDYLGEPFVGNCHWDLAGHFLNQTYTKFGMKLKPEGTVNVSNFHVFDQAAYGAFGPENSMGPEGFIYVPTRCKDGAVACHLHINFHGCLQQMELLGDKYVKQTQLNDWAETNDIVVLYPQTVSALLKGNPMGCYDWWGYTGPNYAFKSGAQMNMVHEMIETLLAY